MLRIGVLRTKNGGRRPPMLPLAGGGRACGSPDTQRMRLPRGRWMDDVEVPAMPHFTNLGDLVRHDRDLNKIAIIDLGGEQAPREVSYAALDAMANGVA